MRTVLAVVVGLVVSGCQKTNREAFDAMRPQWATVRSSLPALAAFVVEGKPGQTVRYQVRPGEEQAARLGVAVHSTMWMDAKRQVYEQLRTLGATITPR